MVNLMGYSVLVDNEEQAKKLQEIAISQGFEWEYGDKKIEHLHVRSFIFGYGGKKVFICSNSHYQDEHITKKAHFNELFVGKFTPIAMRCTQEQFEAIRPKLKGCALCFITDFNSYKYLINNAGGVKNVVTNISESGKSQFNRTVYEEWNEEIFLKACGIEIDTLEQQLERAKAEVERLEKLIKAKKELKRIQNLIDSLENETNS